MPSVSKSIYKSKHKHEYELFIQQLIKDKDFFILKKRCKICGKIKECNELSHIFHKENGTIRLLSTKEDYVKVYGNLEVVYL